MLDFVSSGAFRQRGKPQSRTWHEILRQRDGTSSGASVTIYRSTHSDAPGTVINSRTHQIFEHKVSALEDLENFGMSEDKDLLAEEGSLKELLVVVKRSRAASIVEQDRPPYMLKDGIRHWAHGMTWTDIRRCCYIGTEDDQYDWSLCGEVQVDNYKEVDEHEWTHVW